MNEHNFLSVLIKDWMLIRTHLGTKLVSMHQIMEVGGVLVGVVSPPQLLSQCRWSPKDRFEVSNAYALAKNGLKMGYQDTFCLFKVL